ncbi:DUF1707 SHOCT-like domain-containing protein [Jiangella rhizosphaerae]|uniref:DUF1707 domain-containing protein n=1 Tax=Jiangella rhizosphaerae TaxID=2293569 RepID=A0A418KPG1_9ACTN|nr:DUF1707 domain-containing protein [Jiangella rhizosphaerae]RIQ21280.1 DUF1707 domain-containing protein [Jiangella rhizosphaerae]
MSDLPARRPEQRASDADRELVAEDLRDAFSEGRLDNDEYERRIQAVWESRTYGELDRLTADLPQPLQRERRRAEEEQQKAVAERRKRELREYLDEWQAWAGAAVIMIAIWGISSIASGELRNFWPIWPIGIWGVILLVSGLGGRDKDKGKGV